MSTGLLLTLIGLALIDSVNVSTIWIVVIILLAAKRPGPTGWAYAIGAFITFFAFALALYLGISVGTEWLSELTLWFRRGIFALLAVMFTVFGIRRLKTRPRREFTLPDWVNPKTAFPLGLLATLSDLPNAFPVFLAVDRIVEAGIAPPVGAPLLVGYTVIYALPTIAVLILGLVFQERARDRLQRLYTRFATGEARASWKIASLHLLGAVASLAVLIFVVG